MSTTSRCCWCDPLPCRQALDRSQSQSKLRCSPCIGKKLATDPGILLSFLPSEKPQKRRKRSHTNVSNTLVARPSTPPAQTAHIRFCRRKWVLTRLCSKNRTQRLTRRNRGRFGWGWYHYPRSILRGSETLRGRVSERQTLPLLGLGRVCSRRTRRACGTAMRLCTSLSRGVAAPPGCAIR